MTYELLPADLETKLKNCTSLPSPPMYALQVIELANDPDVSIDRIVQVCAQDPAMVAKILRAANSPLYAQERTVETLHLAILLLGLNATISLALSFSLVAGFQKETSGALDHQQYWKRAGIAAAASRVLAPYCYILDREEVFIASLLQDIGMLALNRVCPDLYQAPNLRQNDHVQVVAHEQKQLGVCHATVGGWLLAQWKFPERLYTAVAYSEDPLQFSGEEGLGKFIRCVAGAGALATLLLTDPTETAFQDIGDKLEAWLDVPRNNFSTIIEQILPAIEDVDHLLDMRIMNELNPADLMDRARECHLSQSLRVCQEVEQLKTSKVSLESQYDQLQDSSQRDGLTDVFNRSFLDKFVEDAFQKSLRDSTPVSLGFIDLDLFKRVNDTYGHQAGDEVLKSVAHILMKQVRACDLVGRYGGEEFLVVLPGTPPAGASVFFNRVLNALGRASHQVSEHQTITVTASIGGATHSQDTPYPTVGDLIQAADQAVYRAKKNGGNQYVVGT